MTVSKHLFTSCCLRLAVVWCELMWCYFTVCYVCCLPLNDAHPTRMLSHPVIFLAARVVMSVLVKGRAADESIMKQCVGADAVSI